MAAVSTVSTRYVAMMMGSASHTAFAALARQSSFARPMSLPKKCLGSVSSSSLTAGPAAQANGPRLLFLYYCIVSFLRTAYTMATKSSVVVVGEQCVIAPPNFPHLARLGPQRTRQNSPARQIPCMAPDAMLTLKIERVVGLCIRPSEAGHHSRARCRWAQQGIDTWT